MPTPDACLLLHPIHGEMPARRVLDCLFALAPDGTILHLHAEQAEVIAPGRVALNETPPQAERARCCIIPPTVVDLRRGVAT